MTTPTPTDDERVAALCDLLVELGIAMSAAGDSVDAIDSSLRAIIAAYDVAHVEVAVLPSSLMVSTGLGTGTQIEIGVPQRARLRFDQVAELYTLVRAASSASISPNEAVERPHSIDRMPPTFRWPVRTLGHDGRLSVDATPATEGELLSISDHTGPISVPRRHSSGALVDNGVP